MNQGHLYREQLQPEAAGRTVLAYLAGRYPHSSEATWRARIDAGEVELEGRPARAEEPLTPGQVLTWRRPPWAEPEVPLHFEVVYEDAELLAVSKPAGLPCEPAGGFLAHTLLTLVRAREPEAAPMHRLGRGTSGLVLYARTASARSMLQAAFRERRVAKRYRALASGALPEGPVAVEAPIGPVAHPVLGELFAASAQGKRARSVVHRAGLAEGNSLADVDIETGRPHQIRIHLAWLGHPLVGDPLYGAGGLPRTDVRALPGDLGYQLHAWRLGLEHPRTGRTLELEAPLPEGLLPT